MIDKNSSNANQSDLLLWIAGGAIAAVGAAWLVIMQPWAGSGGDDPVSAPKIGRASCRERV